MRQRSTARTAADRTGTAVTVGGTAAGTAVQRAGAALSRAGTALEQHSTAAAPSVGSAVGSAVDTAADAVGTLADAVGGFLEEPAVRGGAALDALRGVPVRPPAAVRRWPWSIGAAVLGAAAGAAVALLVHRLQGQDPPGAQEPHELRAVVDPPPEAPATRRSGTGAAGPATSPMATAPEATPEAPPPPA